MIRTLIIQEVDDSEVGETGSPWVDTGEILQEANRLSLGPVPVKSGLFAASGGSGSGTGLLLKGGGLSAEM